jgi:hypothetical protein
MFKIHHQKSKKEIITSSWEYPTMTNYTADYIAYENKRVKIGAGILNYIMRGNQYPKISFRKWYNDSGRRYHFGVNTGLYQFTVAMLIKNQKRR